MNARSPIERMIDAACGIAPAADLPQIVRDFAALVAANACLHMAGFLGCEDQGRINLGVLASVDFALFDLDQRIQASNAKAAEVGK